LDLTLENQQLDGTSSIVNRGMATVLP